ncbi:MAG TPA: acetyltransferase [Anaerolineae bacterium]
MGEPLTVSEKRRLAERVRDACVRAALAGYERAAMDGLCHEGAWEAAIGAIRMLKLEGIVQAHHDELFESKP